MYVRMFQCTFHFCVYPRVVQEHEFENLVSIIIKKMTEKYKKFYGETFG